MPTAAPPAGRRAQHRAQTIADIKAAALRQITEVGAPSLSLRAVARDVGLSIAGMYRYFDTRDALIVALIEDAFDDLARAVDVGDDGDAPDELVRQRSRAYRAWALAHPRLVNLLFTDPIPGFVAPLDGPTAAAARRSMSRLLGPALVLMGRAPAPGADDVGGPPAAPPSEVQAALVDAWSRLHGFVLLEVFHHVDWTTFDRDVEFDRIIDDVIDRLRLTPPA